MAPAPSIRIDVLLPEQQIASDFASALAQRFLDEKFFYWLPLSVAAWVDLCRAPQYRNANRALTLLARAAPELPRLWPAADTLCALGSGEGSKDQLVLAAFHALSRPLLYLATDYSQPLLELALASATAARDRRGLKLDVLSDDHLALLATEVAGAGKSAIYATLGNTLGAFGPQHFPARLRRLMRLGDRALFDGEIFAGEETLRGYDHPVNRRFAFAPLAGLGLTAADGELRFELRPGRNGLHEVAKYFVPARDLVLNLAGRELRFSRGEQLLMSSSLKYDEPAFFRCLQRAGFRLDASWKSDDGRFLLAACSP